MALKKVMKHKCSYCHRLLTIIPDSPKKGYYLKCSYCGRQELKCNSTHKCNYTGYYNTCAHSRPHFCWESNKLSCSIGCGYFPLLEVKCVPYKRYERKRKHTAVINNICNFCGREYEDVKDGDCLSDDCPSNNELSYDPFPKYKLSTTQKDIKAKLQEKFDRDFGLDCKGTAFIHVAVIGTDGVRYGSYKRIDERWLIGRKIKYELVDYAPGILVLDSEFNPKGSVWSCPL